MVVRLLLSLVLISVGPLAAAVEAEDVQTLRRRIDALAEHGSTSGTIASIRYALDLADRIERRYPEQAEHHRDTAARLLRTAEAGRNPYYEATGKILQRGYRSALSRKRQGYAVYIPPNFDPEVPQALFVTLHGGSSNGNLFLGVTLGNNMSWEHYREYWWNAFEPQTFPNAIIVAPDGFGQVMWRWMGEQDVLDVIADVQRNYPVDPDRIVLMGLSNGGVGAYAVGNRHAHRFSLVQAIAGAPSWLLYAGGRPTPDELRIMRPWSALNTLQNLTNTDFRFYHGEHDTGPMRPDFVRQLERGLTRRNIAAQGTWYDAGHDILYRVHRHGQRFDQLTQLRRNPRPRQVAVETGDYRARTQHWLTVSRIPDYPQIGRLRGTVSDNNIQVNTDQVQAFSIDLRKVPTGTGPVSLEVDGALVYDGPKNALGHVIHLRKEGDRFELGFPACGTCKRPAMSGPITDAYYGRIVHVYGTLQADDTDTLRRAAERGARGFPLWLWNYSQEVLSDQEVTQELMEQAHVMAYGSEANHALLARLGPALPFRIRQGAVQAGSRRFEGDGIGVRFVYPNPEAPQRYLLVQGAPTADAVLRGHNLPDFLPDFVVYDSQTTRRRERLIRGRNRSPWAGFFNDRWQLPESPEPPSAPTPSPSAAHRSHGPGADVHSQAKDAKQPAKLPGVPNPAPSPEPSPLVPDPLANTTPEPPPLPVPPAPPLPPRPREFLAPADDEAGRAARAIAQRVPTFHNYRAEIAGARWRMRRGAVWRIRSRQACLAALDDASVPYRPLPEHPTPVPTPVEVVGPIAGVWFRMRHADRPLTVACELAHRMVALAERLKRYNVRGVEVLSAYRETPTASFHTMGLGLDVSRLWNGRRWINVLTDFEETPSEETCGASPATARGREVLRITCDLVRSQLFQSVLTPNYNRGHRNHWHFDMRPDDPRLFHR